MYLHYCCSLKWSYVHFLNSFGFPSDPVLVLSYQESPKSCFLFVIFSTEQHASYIDQNRITTLIYNFSSIIKRSGLFKVDLLFETIPVIVFLVLTISFFVRFEIFLLLTLMLIFGLLLQLVATDEVRIFRTFFIPISFYACLLLIHNENFNSKFKRY